LSEGIKETKMKTRAEQGGEIGINGDTYKGGQFLPSSPDTIKGAMGKADKKAKAYMSRKQEVAAYKWETPPTADSIAIYPTLGGIELFNRDTGTFSLNENFTGGNIEKRMVNIEAWNSGQMWRIK
jgi:hypothetical protein